MTISENINEYISNSKIHGKLAHWNKSPVFVHITPITAQINNKNFLYEEIHFFLVHTTHFNAILTHSTH